LVGTPDQVAHRGEVGLAIEGYDDIGFAAAVAVPLTCVRQPRQQLGQTAAELVMDEAANPRGTSTRRLFTRYVTRRSSMRCTPDRARPVPSRKRRRDARTPAKGDGSAPAQQPQVTGRCVFASQR
jgi:hypothetical protein